MRLLLYNIRYAAGIGMRFHFPVPYSGYVKHTNNHFYKIVDFIKSVNPDIIGLIEVDSGSFRSEKSNQAEIIAREINHRYVYESKYSMNSMAQKVPVMNKQGNAILTSREIKTWQFRYFRKGIKRLVIELELEAFTIFLVHLSLKLRHRQHQLQDLQLMVKDTKRPVIVAGDFNALRGEYEVQSFLDVTGLNNVNGQGTPSHPSRCPRRQLNYILCSPDIRATGFQVPKIKLSDHAPLICDLEIDTSLNSQI